MRRFSRFKGFILTVVACGVLAACALCSYWWQPELPKAKLLAIEFEGMHDNRVALSVEAEILNPNSFALKLEGLEYQVLVGEQELAHGTKTEVVTLEGQKSTQVTLPVNVGFQESISLAARVLFAKEEVKATWRASGWVHVGSTSIPVSFSDSVAIKHP